MNHIEILGLVAAFLTTFSGIPQIVRLLKTRHAKDISLATYVMVTTGIACWLVYGILINDFPLIVANSIGLALNSLVIFFKLRFS